MGFYGDRSASTASTNLIFDKTYGSLWAAKVHVKYDNIYYGRNVLIEYTIDDSIADMYLPVYKNPNSDEFYLYTDSERLNRVKYDENYLDFNKITPDETIVKRDNDLNIVGTAPVVKGQIVKVYEYYNINNEGFSYWQCTGYEINEEEYDATFKQICNYNDDVKVKNEKIDKATGGSGDYDSTVWQRLDTPTGDVYVNIANLNAAFPELHIQAEAPSSSPIAPHFSKDSGGASYHLRVQTPWMFRVAEATTPHSDTSTVWYVPTDAGIQETPVDHAAIYFNKAGFDKTKSNKDNTTTNEIKITSTASGKRYYPHDIEDLSTDTANALAADIQELTINLPIVGNVVSDAYDVIYGEDRKSGNGSLAGYLKVFENLPNNSVPVKSEDGQLIGASLTGNHWIKATANSNTKTITINHTAPEDYEEGQSVYGINNSSPAPGETITIPAFSIDANGHVKTNISNQTITLPAISLENENTGNLVTGLILTPNTGNFIATNANVGTLALTEYVENENDFINATSTINEAFKTLSNELATEITNRESDINTAATALNTAKTELTTAYTTADSNLKTELMTDYGDKIAAETSARGTAISSLDTRLTTEINDRKAAITGEQTDRATAINNAISAEVTNRNNAISSAIGDEVTERNSAITTAVEGEITARNGAITNAINIEITNRDAAIKAAIEALDVTDVAVENQYVSQIAETNGKILVTRANLPDYSNKYDENTKFTYNSIEMTIGDLFSKVADLEARLSTLESPTV